MIDSDQLFKELLKTFFVEFLALFFPRTLEYLDTTTLEFPSLGTFLRATGTNADQPIPFTSDKAIPKCVSSDPPEAFKPGNTFTDCQVVLFRARQL